MRARIFLSCAGVLVAAACGVMPELSASGDASLIVPARYHQAMNATGHVTHVGKENPDGGKRVACRACHDLEKDGFKNPGPGICKTCHEANSTFHHGGDAGFTLDGGARAEVTCLTCHPFDVVNGQPPPITPWICLDCHDRPQNQKVAVEAHQSACFYCHQPHRAEFTQPTECTICHQIGLAHGAKGDSVAKSCMKCHEQHRPAAEASKECVACHSDEKEQKKKSSVVTKAALFEEHGKGHKSCGSCHLPHKFDKKAVKTCTACHKDQVVLALGATPKTHTTCMSCHAPHAGKTGAPKTCQTAGCHADVKSSHPTSKDKPENRHPCMSCHPMHDALPKPKQVAKTCESCHKEEKFTGVVHGKDKDGVATSCDDCHKKHDFKVAKESRVACKECHAQLLTATAKVKKNGHAKCEDCHAGLPHKPLPDQRKTCVSCHEKLKPPQKGHDDCSKCHETHSGAKLKACLDCHKVPELEGLHMEVKHQKCDQCHAAHNPQPDERNVCLSCHKDKATHEPKAPRCANCHLFREVKDAPGEPGAPKPKK